MEFNDREYKVILAISKQAFNKDLGEQALIAAHEEIERLQPLNASTENVKLRETSKVSEALWAEIYSTLKEVSDFAEENIDSPLLRNNSRLAHKLYLIRKSSYEVLQSQPKPKMLAVLEAAQDIGHDSSCDVRAYDEDGNHYPCNCPLGKALAAMKEDET